MAKLNQVVNFFIFLSLAVSEAKLNLDPELGRSTHPLGPLSMYIHISNDIGGALGSDPHHKKIKGPP